MALTVLLALCVRAFAVRRLRDVRYQSARRAVTRSQMRQLRTMASHDPLTGLANRRELDSALAAAIASSANGQEHAFFLIDLNGFKSINDLYGHAIGQRMMATLGSEIRVGGRSHKPGASIGVALIPQNGSTPDEIVHHADIAMYRAKSEDKTALVFFEPPAAIN